MLLRYIHAVKEHALAVSDGSGGILQLPESNIGDEEVHALAALLRSNTSIQELNLRGNHITDDGARALAAILSGKSAIKMLDLKGNKVSKAGIKTLAEALERSEKVKHVYVHAGGKIEALGSESWTKTQTQTDSGAGRGGVVETVCVVDVRDNSPEQTSFPYGLETATSIEAQTQAFKPILMPAVTKPPSLEKLEKSHSTKGEGKKEPAKVSKKSRIKVSLFICLFMYTYLIIGSLDERRATQGFERKCLERKKRRSRYRLYEVSAESVTNQAIDAASSTSLGESS